MRNHSELIRIIKIILENEERILRVRGGRGKGVGHPIYNNGKVSFHLGKQPDEEEVQPSTEPVKISKAFKNKKRK